MKLDWGFAGELLTEFSSVLFAALKVDGFWIGILLYFQNISFLCTDAYVM